MSDSSAALLDLPAKRGRLYALAAAQILDPAELERGLIAIDRSVVVREVIVGVRPPKRGHLLPTVWRDLTRGGGRADEPENERGHEHQASNVARARTIFG
jgi:hypothetical protein